MKKLKIYLDTSVISHLKQNDAPEKSKETLLFWNDIKKAEYDIIISSVTTKEILACNEPKRSLMLDYLSEIDFKSIEIDEEINNLANEIIKRGILSKNKMADCTHIAAAIVSGCDIIVSWNFKHMVNIKTIHGIREITISQHYKQIDIYPPTLLLKGGESSE